MEKKKSPLYFFFPFFFGDVIIHKTGTMLATGQGPGATPSGKLGMGTVRGVRDRCGGGRGWGNNELGLKLKFLSGAPRAPRNETDPTPELGRCGSGAKLW